MASRSPDGDSPRRLRLSGRQLALAALVMLAVSAIPAVLCAWYLSAKIDHVANLVQLK